MSTFSVLERKFGALRVMYGFGAICVVRMCDCRRTTHHLVEMATLLLPYTHFLQGSDASLHTQNSVSLWLHVVFDVTAFQVEIVKVLLCFNELLTDFRRLVLRESVHVCQQLHRDSAQVLLIVT